MWQGSPQLLDFNPRHSGPPAATNTHPAKNLLASPWHTALVVVALGINAYLGYLRAATLRHAQYVNRPALYLRTLAVEWLMLALVLAGVWLHKSSFEPVMGERWHSLRSFLRDSAIAIAFTIISISVSTSFGSHSHTSGTAQAVKFLIPDTTLERCLWVLLALSAGICEEAVFRGYLQHQFIAATRNIPVGITLSALLFGASHAYQGSRPAFLIGFVAALSGVLAWWRKSVRPGMIAHALQDLLAIFVRH